MLAIKKWKLLPALLLSALLAVTMLPVLPGTVKVAGAASVGINAENFPDENFRGYVSSNFDTDKDGNLSDAEAARVLTVSVAGKEIKSLKGIEAFPKLRELDCGFNELDVIDVSKNTELRKLFCWNNSITDLHIENLAKLTELSCSNNSLARIDASHNKELKILRCANNQIVKLDVTGNPALELLSCEGNHLSSLDVTKNSKLKELGCSDDITEMDLSGNPNLNRFGCTKKVENKPLTKLNLSGADSLGKLTLNNCSMDKLDLSGKASLDEFTCSNSNIESLDISGAKNLHRVDCEYNGIGSVKLGGNGNLYHLGLTGNRLTSLDVSECPKLTELRVSDNRLTSLDVSNNPELTEIFCRRNRLQKIDVSKNNNMRQLHCDYNRLGELVIGTLPEFRLLNCQGNRLHSLELGGTTQTMSYNGQEQVDTVSAEKTEDGYIIDLKKDLGIDVSRVKVTEVKGGTYDKDAGRVVFSDPLSNAAFFRYVYNTNRPGADLSVKINANATPLISTGALADAKQNSKYRTYLDSTAEGCTWKIVDGSLPDGLVLHPTTGEISGTPKAEGTFSFTVEVRKGTAFSTKAMSLNVAPEKTAVSVRILTESLPAGTVSTAYEAGLQAEEQPAGDPGVKWSIVGGALPDGLSLDEATGMISGTPAKTGTFTFTVKAEKGTASDTAEYSIAIDPGTVVPEPGSAEQNITVDIDKIQTTKGEKDPAGSLYGMLRLRYTKTSSRSISMKWQKVAGVKTYAVIAGRCGGSYKVLKRTTGTSFKAVRAAGKKLKKGRYYKFIVAAYDKDGKRIAVSKTIHVVTKGGKYGNYKSVKFRNVKKGRKTLRTGKKFRIKARAVKTSKKLKARRHRGMRFESSNPKVAAVTKTGTVTARAKGKCTIYAYTQDGRSAGVSITVK
ncbi:MAG: putative Ig domain-containing protein [Anaerovoracaceae bacterium]|jgi:hypothetical protein